MTNNSSEPGAKGTSGLLEPVDPQPETPIPARVEAPPNGGKAPENTVPFTNGYPPPTSEIPTPVQQPAPYTQTPAPVPQTVPYTPTSYTPTPARVEQTASYTPSYAPGQPGYEPTPQRPLAYPPAQNSGASVLWVIMGVLLAIFVFGAILFAAAYAITGRTVESITSSVGPLTTDTQSIPVGSVTSANVNLDMGAGDITVKGGSANLVDASYTYNVPSWKPEASYNSSGNTGTFDVWQPDIKNISVGNMRNEWNIRLGNSIPTDLKISLGAGNVNANLGGLAVKSLTVDNHTGNTTVDLTGQWKNNLDARITGSVGNTTIRVPSDVGVRITAHKNFGNITANGLKADGNVYTNDAYGKSPVTLNIDANVDLGNLVMEAR
jgi:N-terminal domain of toast_rack, DUF2154